MINHCANHHRLVTLQSATIVSGPDGDHVVERGVCKGCGNPVERRRAIKRSRGWAVVDGPPTTTGIVYACIPPHPKSA